MPLSKLLIANRGEIAIRIARSAADLDLPTVMVASEDDAASLHTRRGDALSMLTGAGPAAYLDGAQVIAAARETGCDAVHPGYGFLSENAGFAAACAQAGLTFVGPAPETLVLFGDKGAARGLAQRCGVPVMPGTAGPTSLEQAEAFLASLGEGGAVMLKAIAGGGGRGMRPVTRAQDLPDAYARCASEALQSFGNGDLYVERLFPRARHVEVQVVGDGDAVSHLWDRECSLQRQRQKLVEIAPASSIPDGVRERLLAASLTLAREVGYRSLGTFEFLVGEDGEYAFIEANARLQVEHTVTEAVLGLDLVRAQLQIASGATLADLGLTQAEVPAPRGTAVQARVNLETMAADGSARPGGGVIAAYEPPSGPGVRVDGFGYGGYRTSARFDSLLVKVIVTAPMLQQATARTARALAEFKLTGVASNLGFLQALLRRPEVAAGQVHTRWVEEQMAALVEAAAQADGPKPWFEAQAQAPAARPGSKVDAIDPLAVLAHGKTGALAAPEEANAQGPDGTTAVRAPIQGALVSLSAVVGSMVRQGEPLAVMEAMKMEHVVTAPVSGVVRAISAAPGEAVFEDAPLLFIEVQAVEGAAAADEAAVDMDHIRPDLAEVIARHAYTLDANRHDAVARRRKTGQRTARENIEDLCDPGSFLEYGALTVAAQRRRRSVQELIERTPADGLVMGLGAINGAQFPEDKARAAVLSYDYTVLAGTQGARNHHKMDRLLEVSAKQRLPLVFFTEGGGGRPGDTEGGGGFVRGFELMAQLSGSAPLVGIASGRCFAGNAAVLGCCDVVIAARDATLGMGGPAMVEGGGLGVFTPEEIGPIEVQQKNGVIDVLVDDEAHGTRVAKQYLSYFQGPLADWTCADQRLLRRAIPENRLRVYDPRALIATLCDEGSVLELRPKFGAAMITALVRVEGRPAGLIANNPQHLGGAIDSDASDKAARFMQLCEAYDLPIVSLSDTPGNMVGPEAEKTALIRHCSRLFVIGANLTVPILSLILRKSYGLGAIAMTGGSYQAARFVASWPTGEFGGMGLEGAVKLGYRNELAAIADPGERRARFDEMVAAAYEGGKALSTALYPALDAVIDPADTRRWIMAGLRSQPPVPPRTGKKLPWIDAW